MLPFLMMVKGWILALLAIMDPLIIVLSSISTLSMIKERSIKQLEPMLHFLPMVEEDITLYSPISVSTPIHTSCFRVTYADKWGGLLGEVAFPFMSSTYSRYMLFI